MLKNGFETYPGDGKGKNKNEWCDCSICNGTGKINGNKCETCNGSGKLKDPHKDCK